MFIAASLSSILAEAGELIRTIAGYLGLALMIIGWVLLDFCGGIMSEDDCWLIPVVLMGLGAALASIGFVG